MKKPSLLLLDRDGVINRDLPRGVCRREEFQFIEGSLKAIRLLSEASITLAIVTNQSAVSKGLMKEETLHSIHNAMLCDIEKAGGTIAQIYYCTDHPDRPTHRRKPHAGMIEEALRDTGTAPENALLIGDALRDLLAAEAAHCPRMLVKTGKGRDTIAAGLPESLRDTPIHNDLLAAAHAILYNK